jgi:hypothetical protein
MKAKANNNSPLAEPKLRTWNFATGTDLKLV